MIAVKKVEDYEGDSLVFFENQFRKIMEDFRAEKTRIKREIKKFEREQMLCKLARRTRDKLVNLLKEFSDAVGVIYEEECEVPQARQPKTKTEKSGGDKIRRRVLSGRERAFLRKLEGEIIGFYCVIYPPEVYCAGLLNCDPDDDDYDY